MLFASSPLLAVVGDELQPSNQPLFATLVVPTGHLFTESVRVPHVGALASVGLQKGQRVIRTVYVQTSHAAAGELVPVEVEAVQNTDSTLVVVGASAPTPGIQVTPAGDYEVDQTPLIAAVTAGAPAAVIVPEPPPVENEVPTATLTEEEIAIWVGTAGAASQPLATGCETQFEIFPDPLTGIPTRYEFHLGDDGTWRNIG